MPVCLLHKHLVNVIRCRNLCLHRQCMTMVAFAMHCHKLSFKVEIYSSTLPTLFMSTLFMTTFGSNLSCKVLGDTIFIPSHGTVNFTIPPVIAPLAKMAWGSGGSSLVWDSIGSSLFWGSGGLHYFDPLPPHSL